jgi:hypothetical protein
MSVGMKRQNDGPQAATIKAPAKATPQERVERDPQSTVMVEVPVSDEPLQGYQSSERSARHLEVQLREPAQAKAFMRMRSGLYASGARLANGTPVASNADCLRWLIEQIGAA